MCFLLCVINLVIFARAITTNDIADEDVLYFGKCLDSASNSSISCIVSQNYSAPPEEQDLSLIANTTYTVSSNSTEIFCLTLDLKKVFIFGEVFFNNLKVGKFINFFICLLDNIKK
jgi:hypothetical protein